MKDKKHERTISNNKNVDKKLLDKLGIIGGVITVFGAFLWIVSFLRETKLLDYTYAVLFFLGAFLVVLFIIFSYLCNAYHSKNKNLQIVFFILSNIMLLLFIVFGCLCITWNIDKSRCPYYVYRVTDCILGEKDEIPLEAISEAIAYSQGEGEDYYSARGDLYMKMYKNYSLTSNYKSDSLELYKHDCLDNAVSDYTVALLANNDNLNYRFERGKAYRYMGYKYYGKSESDLKYVYESDKSNSDYMLEYGKLLLVNKDYDLQEMGLSLIYDSAELKYNRNSIKYYQYILLALNDLDMSDDMFDESDGFGINNLYSKLGDKDNSEMGGKKTSNVVSVLGNHKKYAESLINGMSDYVDDIKDYDPKIVILYEYSTVLQALDKYDEALFYIDLLIKEYPTYIRAYEERSFINSNLKKYDDALADIDELIEINNSTTYHVYRANILYIAGRYVDAIKEYNYVAQRDSNRTSYSLFSIAQSYYKLGDFNNARMYLCKALEENPNEEIMESCYYYLNILNKR